MHFKIIWEDADVRFCICWKNLVITVLLWVNMCYLFEYAGILMSDARQSI